MWSYRPRFHRISAAVAFRLIVIAVNIGIALFACWLVFERPQDLRLQRKGELNSAADLVVKILKERVDETFALMSKPDQLSPLLGERDVLITISNNNLVTLPTTPLPYVPDELSDVGDEAPLGTFHAVDDLLKRGDPQGALIALRPFLGMSNPLIVTGAQIREARALDRSGQLKQALSAYDSLIGSGARRVAVDNAPADLLAAVERVELLARAGAPFREVADAVRARILAGEWKIPHGIFVDFIARLSTAKAATIPDNAFSTWFSSTQSIPFRFAIWLSSKHSIPFRHRIQVADAVDYATNLPRAGPKGSIAIDQYWDTDTLLMLDPKGSIAIDQYFDTDTLLWLGLPDHRRVLFAGPVFVRTNWFAAIRPIEEAYMIHASVGDGPKNIGRTKGRLWAFQTLTGHFWGELHPALRRTRSETGLPWDVDLFDRNVLKATAAWSRLWAVGVATLLFAFAYTSARSVHRELSAMRHQSDFVSAVSHEIRTPLTSIRQLGEMLAEGRSATVGKLSIHHAALVRQTRRLERTVERLLQFGQLEAGVPIARLEVVDIASLFRKIVDEFSADPAARGHVCELDITDMNLRIMGDPSTLEHAVWNVLDNAAKYSTPNHPIRVEVGSRKKLVTVTVTDQGIGIEHRDQRRVFARFVRGREARESGIEGNGIGLTLVRHIVAAHHGSARIVSAGRGRGTTVILSFPLAEVR